MESVRLESNVPCILSAVAILAATEERREHLLEAGNKQVRFPAALGQLFYLRVFCADLAAEKFHLAFKTRDIPIIVGTNGRVWSRLFVAVRRLTVLIFHSANVRVWSRLFATVRDCSHLIDVGDVAVNGVGRDKIFFAGLGLDFMAVEL